MTNVQFWIKHEKKIKAIIWQMTALLFVAATLVVLPFVGILRPSGQTIASWWQRAGAPVAIFAFLAQNKAQHLSTLLTPGSMTSAEMESLRKKFRRSPRLGTYVASFLTVVGTVIWGYGDLIVEFFKK